MQIYQFDVDEERTKWSAFKELDVYMRYMEKGPFDKIYKRYGPIPIEVVGEVALATSEAMSFLYDGHRIIPRCEYPSGSPFT